MTTARGVSNGRRTFANMLTLAGGHIGSTVILVGTTPYFYGALGPSRYGLLMLFYAFVQYASVVDFGLGPGLVKYVAEDHAKGELERIREMMSFSYLFYAGVAVIILSLVFVFGHFIVAKVHMPAELRPEAFPLLMGFACNFFFSQFSFTLAGLIAGIGRLDVSSSIRASGLVLYVAFAVVALHFGLGIYGVLASSFVTTALTIPVMYLFARHKLGPVFCAPTAIRWSTIRRLFVTGGWIQFSSIMYLIYAQTDGIVIGFVVNVAAVGLFDLASRLSRAIRAMAYYVGTALLPAMSALEARRGRDGVQAGMVDGSRYVAAVSFALMGFAVVSAPLIFSAWLGARTDQQALLVTLLIVLCLTAVVDNFIAMPLTFLRAVGLPRLESVYSVSTCIGKVALIVVLAPRYGVMGVVMGSFIASLVGSIIFLSVFCRAREVHFVQCFGTPLVKLFCMTAVSSTVTAFVSHVWLRHGSPSRPTAFAELLINGIIYATSFIAMVGVTRFLHERDRVFVKRIIPARLIPPVDGRLVRFLFAGNR